METCTSEAAPEARVSANQNLPGSAIVRLAEFVGVSRRLHRNAQATFNYIGNYVH